MIPNFIFEFTAFIFNLDTGEYDHHPSIEVKVSLPLENRFGRFVGTRNLPFTGVSSNGFYENF